MSQTHYLQLPLTEEAVRNLKAGDMVYLTGEIIVTAGMPTHERMLQYLDEGKPMPVSLKDQTLLHFGSCNKEVDGKFDVEYMNPTTSTRFNPYMPRIIRGYGLRAVGGKGGLSAESVKAMQEQGCVYLSFLGGGCTLLSNAIREVVSVSWNDLLQHYRLVKMRVENLGPGTVGIDAHGNSLYDSLQEKAQNKLPEIMAKLNAERKPLPGKVA